jgi:DNA ligase (NAD+)
MGQGELTLGTTDWSAMSVAELEESLRYHNTKYWVDDDPEISDFDYDQLVEALRAKAPDSPVLDAIGADGAAAIAGIEESDKVAHDPPMLSLDKCYEEDTLTKWFGKFDGKAVVTPKIDGVATCIRYDANGDLVLAATRGNGKVGENITEQVKRIDDVPHKIPRGPLEVRGESYMPLDVFDAKFKGVYKSPRNIVAGALKQKDAAKTADFHVHFFAYDLVGVDYETEEEQYAILEELGFTHVPCHVSEHKDLQQSFDDMVAERPDWNYEADGVVYKANDVEEQERMGYTSHHPRYAIAYKFVAETSEATLEKIEWSVSRTGAINPVAIISPTSLAGAVITRVSLHNLAIMDALGGEDSNLCLGSTVEVSRRGGVIPQIEKVITAGDEEIQIPDRCPSCGGDTRREGDFLFADHNSHCRVLRITKLEHFTKVMEIKGFGSKHLESLVDEGLVTTPPEFYELEVDDLLDLDRMGETLATKLVANIQAKKTVHAAMFLRSFGIHEIGKHVSAILANEFDTMDEVFDLTAEDFAKIHTIGDVIAKAVTQGLVDHRDEIDALLEYVTPVFPEKVEEPEGGPLEDQSFLFTGTLATMKRKDAQAAVVALGAQAPSGVSKALTYLVIGDADYDRYANEGWKSSKIKKAEKYIGEGADLEIINETKFTEILTNAQSASDEEE